MNKLLYLLFLLGVSGIYACRKEPVTNTVAIKKSCWQLIDRVGQNLGEVCDKTEAELKEELKKKSVDGFNYTDCNYYAVEGNKSCYLINGRLYRNLFENQAKLYARC
jgi:hypothetical protein